MKVLLFARCREIVGQGELDWATTTPHTVAEFKHQLGLQYPPLSALLKVTLVAVDNQYVTTEHVLNPQDTIALIPPVSGG